MRDRLSAEHACAGRNRRGPDYLGRTGAAISWQQRAIGIAPVIRSGFSAIARPARGWQRGEREITIIKQAYPAGRGLQTRSCETPGLIVVSDEMAFARNWANRVPPSICACAAHFSGSGTRGQGPASARCDRIAFLTRHRRRSAAISNTVHTICWRARDEGAYPVRIDFTSWKAR